MIVKSCATDGFPAKVTALKFLDMPAQIPVRVLSFLCLAGLCGLASGQTTSPIKTTVASGTTSLSSFSLAKQGQAGSSGAMPRVFVPTLPRTAYTRYPWKTDITATVFWIGESPTANNPTPNHKSSWDTEWQKNFGGFDDPDPSRRTSDYCPVGFKPGLNPFYIALPYNDVLNYKTTKSEAAKMIPWYKQRFTREGRSVLKGTWVAIRYGNRVCYAQWEDCGPFVTDDVEYVFGSARPKNQENGGAGIDISPAVRDYLGIRSGAKCDWRFVDLNEVAGGPWCTYGANNHFVQSNTARQASQRDAIASRLDELRRLRDEYFKKNGNR